MLHGRVRDERARPVVGAAVTITWQTDFAIVPNGPGAALSARERTLGALSDDNGYWRLCGVPRDQALVVRAATDSGSDTQKARLGQGEDFSGVDLVLHKQTSNSAREAAVL